MSDASLMTSATTLRTISFIMCGHSLAAKHPNAERPLALSQSAHFQSR